MTTQKSHYSRKCCARYDDDGKRTALYSTVRAAALEVVRTGDQRAVCAAAAVNTAAASIARAATHGWRAYRYRWRTAASAADLPETLTSAPRIAVYDPDGYLVGVFPTMRYAAQHLSESGDPAAATKYRRMHFRYIPIAPDDTPASMIATIPLARGRLRPVRVIYPDDAEQVFSSTSAAARAIGVPTSTVFAHLQRGTPIPGTGERIVDVPLDVRRQFEEARAELRMYVTGVSRAQHDLSPDEHAALQSAKVTDRTDTDAPAPRPAAAAPVPVPVASESDRHDARDIAVVSVGKGLIELDTAAAVVTTDAAPVDPFGSAFGAVSAGGITGTVSRRRVLYR